MKHLNVPIDEYVINKTKQNALKHNKSLKDYVDLTLRAAILTEALREKNTRERKKLREGSE